MKRVCLLIILFSFFSLKAQIPSQVEDNYGSIESLNDVIKSSKNDSLICISYLKLSSIYIRLMNIDLASSQYDKANEYIKGNKYLTDISYSFKSRIVFLKEADVDKHLKSLEQAIAKLKQHKNLFSKNLLLKNIIQIGQLYAIQNNFSKSNSVFLNEAIPLAKKLKDNVSLSIIYSGLGANYYETDSFLKAETYVNKSIKLDESNSQLKIKSIMGNNYLLLGQIGVGYNDKIKSYEALKNMDKAAKIMIDEQNSNFEVLELTSINTSNFSKTGHRDVCRFYDNGIFIAKKSRNGEFLPELQVSEDGKVKLNQLGVGGDVLSKILNKDKIDINDKEQFAKDLFNGIDSLVKKEGIDVNLSKIADTLKKDSVFSEEIKPEVKNFEDKYHKRQSEKEIKLLNYEKKQVELKIKNRNLYLIIFVLASSILLLTLFFLIRNSKNQKNILLEKELN